MADTSGQWDLASRVVTDVLRRRAGRNIQINQFNFTTTTPIGNPAPIPAQTAVTQALAPSQPGDPMDLE
jgi:hypothetical protein